MIKSNNLILQFNKRIRAKNKKLAIILPLKLIYNKQQLTVKINNIIMRKKNGKII